ncbi:hypothetical protein QFZ63_001098 [Streptomyces sp. B3I7]|nr:hypothetical protein [Streptomyces sp. B3I8]MDQ0809384.1 hypothetical protein [Streptomyces sp. B3I7]
MTADMTEEQHKAGDTVAARLCGTPSMPKGGTSPE